MDKINEKFAGMTVNERLFETKNIEKFDKMVQDFDIIGISYLLCSLSVCEEDTKNILKSMGLIK